MQVDNLVPKFAEQFEIQAMMITNAPRSRGTKNSCEPCFSCLFLLSSFMQPGMKLFRIGGKVIEIENFFPLFLLRRCEKEHSDNLSMEYDPRPVVGCDLPVFDFDKVVNYSYSLHRLAC